MTRDADIVVVGAGITGASAARALAQAGRGVLLVEQFEPGHDRGSSHGGSRIFRLSYPDQHFVRLAQGALQSWRELEAECGEQLIVPTGALDFGPVALENARALAACGVRHELLTDTQVRSRWPITAEPGEPILFHPDAGITLSGRAWEVTRRRRGRGGRRAPRRPPRHGDRGGARLGAGEHRRRGHRRARVRRRRGRVGAWSPRRRGDRAAGDPDEGDGDVLRASRRRSTCRP